jgi:hypothetical protein
MALHVAIVLLNSVGLYLLSLTLARLTSQPAVLAAVVLLSATGFYLLVQSALWHPNLLPLPLALTLWGGASLPDGAGTLARAGVWRRFGRRPTVAKSRHTIPGCLGPPTDRRSTATR